MFWDDINRLLAMEDMWKVAGRVKPVALDYDTIMSNQFVTPPLRVVLPANGSKKEEAANGSDASASAPVQNGASSSTNGTANGSSAASQKLKDQKELSVKENLELFVDRSASSTVQCPFRG